MRAEKSAGTCFLKPFFRIRENFFQSFLTKFLSLLYMRSLEYKISRCFSANQNPELRCVICTGVTLFALVLHSNCTALSQSESSTFFMCIIKIKIVLPYFSWVFFPSCVAFEPIYGYSFSLRWTGLLSLYILSQGWVLRRSGPSDPPEGKRS